MGAVSSTTVILCKTVLMLVALVTNGMMVVARWFKIVDNWTSSLVTMGTDSVSFAGRLVVEILALMI